MRFIRLVPLIWRVGGIPLRLSVLASVAYAIWFGFSLARDASLYETVIVIVIYISTVVTCLLVAERRLEAERRRRIYEADLLEQAEEQAIARAQQRYREDTVGRD